LKAAAGQEHHLLLIKAQMNVVYALACPKP
jgi:hypothetical protein